MADLSVERGLVRSGVIGVGHAEQIQQSALEPAQLGREDHGWLLLNLERVTLHVIE
jgi:hypothetical protein